MGWREQQKFLGVAEVGVCGRMKSLEVNERALLFEGSLGWATLGVCAGAVLLLLLELGPCACVLLLGASCRPSVCRPVSMLRFGSGRICESASVSPLLSNVMSDVLRLVPLLRLLIPTGWHGAPQT